MPTARRLSAIPFLTTLALASSISCTSSSSPTTGPGERVASLRITVAPNPIVQTGIGACVGESGQSVPGTFRLFPHEITVEETGGVGVTIQSHRITALAGGQEFPVIDMQADAIGERFNNCGGTGSRIEPFQRRCETGALFCTPPSRPVPEQLRLSFVAADDNGNPIAGDVTVNLSVP